MQRKRGQVKEVKAQQRETTHDELEDDLDLDPEQQIIVALAQLQVLDTLFLALANNKSLDLVPDQMGAASYLTGSILKTFERLDIVQLVVNARGENARRQGR